MLKKPTSICILLLGCFLHAHSQCNLDFADAILFPFSGDIVNGASSGANESATHSFDEMES